MHLRRNLLPELPEAFWSLPNVETLSLGENPGLTIPDEIAKLSSLRRLYLHDNELAPCPTRWGSWQGWRCWTSGTTGWRRFRRRSATSGGWTCCT